MKAILFVATILLAACAGTPSPKTDAKVIEPIASHEPAETNAKNAADLRFAEETRGYKLVAKNGQNYYCRSERASGSNLKTMNCVTENELRVRVEQAEMYRRRSAVGVRAE